MDEMMRVTFVLEDESTFCIEVRFFDSFQEIKERIKNHKGIPVYKQKLMFEGKVLDDKDIILSTDISEASRVQLILTPPTVSPPPNIDDENVVEPQWILDMPMPNLEELLSSLHPQTTTLSAPQTPEIVSENALPQPPYPASLPPPLYPALTPPPLYPAVAPPALYPWPTLAPPPLCPSPPPPRLCPSPPQPRLCPPLAPAPLYPELPPAPPTRTEFMVKNLGSKKEPFSIEMNLNVTVFQLKEKIYKMLKPRPKYKREEMEIRIKTGEELPDHKSLGECGMLNISQVYVRKRIATPIYPGRDSNFGKMITVMAVDRGRSKKVPIVVNARCSVNDLRFELEKFHKYALPRNGREYYFTNNQTGAIMVETNAFEWPPHGIQDGDSIEITPSK